MDMSNTNTMTTYQAKPQTVADILTIREIVGEDGKTRQLIQTAHCDGLEYDELGSARKLVNRMKEGFGLKAGIVFHQGLTAHGVKGISYSYLP